MSWRLREEKLEIPFGKLYDDGVVDDWIGTYEDAGAPEDLRFAGAFAGDELLGLLTWRPMTWNETLWLVDIRVQEAVRGRGIGSHLLAYLDRQAPAFQARGISVETQINNYPAVRFYQKHGYRVAGFHDHLYTNTDVKLQNVAVYLFKELP
ncbi:MAG TPA: GNAT family N-acetyltransferase [Chloroflexota bacterium]|nr:GNAT family N-acetyltransferase [Chloroflexota bacterium]